jgi:hypothetical protein
MCKDLDWSPSHQSAELRLFLDHPTLEANCRASVLYGCINRVVWETEEWTEASSGLGEKKRWIYIVGLGIYLPQGLKSKKFYRTGPEII